MQELLDFKGAANIIEGVTEEIPSPTEVYSRLSPDAHTVVGIIRIFPGSITASTIQFVLQSDPSLEIDLERALGELSNHKVIERITPETVARRIVSNYEHIYGKLKEPRHVAQICTRRQEREANRNFAAQAQLRDNPTLGGVVTYQLNEIFK